MEYEAPAEIELTNDESELYEQLPASRSRDMGSEPIGDAMVLLFNITTVLNAQKSF